MVAFDESVITKINCLDEEGIGVSLVVLEQPTIKYSEKIEQQNVSMLIIFKLTFEFLPIGSNGHA